eukprot:1160180-Pelagomonas_calceolata.AAC.7
MCVKAKAVRCERIVYSWTSRILEKEGLDLNEQCVQLHDVFYKCSFLKSARKCVFFAFTYRSSE